MQLIPGEILFGHSILMILGSPFGSIIVLAPIPLLLYRIGIEEKALFSRFGQEYLDYANKTRKLIPYIY